MKPIDVASDSFDEYNEESNEKDSRFKVNDHVRISKYKNIFAKVYAPNWSEEMFDVKKIKNTVTWTYVVSDLNGEEIIASFYEKELQKTNQKESRIENVIKRKGNKLYVKWKGYNNSFNRWIDKKDLIIRVNTFHHIVDNTDTTVFVLKAKYDTDKSDLEKKLSDAGKKIPVANGLVKKTNLNATITEIEGKIPNITVLATNSALTAVENKIPDVSS